MKKGFTLVELLGVVVILTLIATIITVNVINVVKNTDSYIDDTTKTLLYTATERYLNDKLTLKANDNYVITIKTLMDNEYISSYFVDSQDNKEITENSCVKVSVRDGNINYEFSRKCR